ncbi:hypothetical protein M8J77_013291 [Diaphorina citri]|nr:hypothetical protein M8J77_013291 [Diaphorina citri]
MPGSYLPRNLLTFFNYPPSGTLVVKFQSRGRLAGYWQRQDSLTPSATRWNSRSTWTRQCLAPHRVNSDWIYLDRYSRVTSLYQRTSTVQCYNTLENWLQGLISGTRIKRAGRCAIAASAYRRHPACGNTKQSFELLRHLKLNPEKDFSSPKIDFVLT